MKEYTKKEIGDIGENIATAALIQKGYRILDRNYRKKWGELDIVCKKGNTIHFVEVKTIAYKNAHNVSQNTEKYRPEENLHPKKLERIQRAAKTYMIEYETSEQAQVDLVAVEIFLENKHSQYKIIENVL